MDKPQIETIFQRCNAKYNARIETEPGECRQSAIMVFFWILTPIFCVSSLYSPTGQIPWCSKRWKYFKTQRHVTYIVNLWQYVVILSFNLHNKVHLPGQIMFSRIIATITFELAKKNCFRKKKTYMIVSIIYTWRYKDNFTRTYITEI